jgi:hypothetical protein
MEKIDDGAIEFPFNPDISPPDKKASASGSIIASG